MRAIFPGEIKVFIIQHTRQGVANVKHLDSNRLINYSLEDVADWTKRGMYSEATIIDNHTWNPDDPALQSFIIGMETSLKEKADFHVWLEDDALLCDLECDKWPELLKDKEVGVYYKNNIVNPAFLVTKQSFDEKILKLAKNGGIKLSALFIDYGKPTQRLDVNSKQIEMVMENTRVGDKALLKTEYVGRTHQGEGGSLTSLIKNMPPELKKMMEDEIAKNKAEHIKLHQ
jgi:hypothetical protein